MFASPSRRHRLRASFATAVVGIGLLAGCTGQQTPGGYGDSVERNFLRGCTTTAEADGATFEADGEAFDPEEFCGCVYGTLSGDGELAMDFDDFKSINGDQIEEPSQLPASMTRVTDSCRERQGEAAGGETGGSTTSEPDADQDSTSTTEG